MILIFDSVGKFVVYDEQEFFQNVTMDYDGEVTF